MADVSQLTDVAEIQRRLAAIREQERKEDLELRQMLAKRPEFDLKMESLQRLRPKLGKLHADSKDLFELVGSTCSLAENISSKVRELDLAKGRLQSAIRRVEDIIDLKSCVEGASAALASQNYETAAAFVHRYLSFDKAVFASETDQSSKEAFTSLDNTHEEIMAIVRDRFALAVRQRDLPNVTRFTKLFPLVGLRAEGLQQFEQYLCSLAAGVSSEGSYVDRLTHVFEHIAKIIDENEPLVDTHFGPGSMAGPIAALQQQCDSQAETIVTSFIAARKLESVAHTVSRLLASSTFPENAPDPREFDTLLAELALLMARGNLYFAFVRRRFTSHPDATAVGAHDSEECEKLIRNSGLNRQLQVLAGLYIPLEEYYMKRSVHKALAVDKRDPATALVSTMVDDCFFILSQCSRRALSTCNVDCFCATVNHLVTLLLSDFTSVLRVRLQPRTTIDFSSLQERLQAGLSSNTRVNFAPYEAVLIAMNNAEKASEYATQLAVDLKSECDHVFASHLSRDQVKLESCLGDVTGLAPRFLELIEVSRQFSSLVLWHAHSTRNIFTTQSHPTLLSPAYQCQLGLLYLRSAVLEPRLRAQAEAAFEDSYELSEEDIANFDTSSPQMASFIVAQQSLLLPLRDLLSPDNTARTVLAAAEASALLLERAAMQCRFNRLGGLQFDRDLRALLAQIATLTQWSVRDKMARLVQMATILNLDKVSEFLEYWGPAAQITWRLSPAEVRRVLALRTDFRAEEISRLRL
eukprot:m.142150 g.142150  ORF g.142150 m.142150 type:complete len:752 (+) comp14970_c0_seq2:16-2271(+)